METLTEIRNPELSYATAMRRILEVNPKLKELYGRTQVVMPTSAAEFTVGAGTTEDKQTVRNHVNELILLQMQVSGEEDYSKAMDALFEARPELKAAYARS